MLIYVIVPLHDDVYYWLYQEGELADIIFTKLCQNGAVDSCHIHAAYTPTYITDVSLENYRCKTNSQVAKVELCNEDYQYMVEWEAVRRFYLCRGCGGRRHRGSRNL